jgi:hypothetical protein
MYVQQNAGTRDRDLIRSGYFCKGVTKIDRLSQFCRFFHTWSRLYITYLDTPAPVNWNYQYQTQLAPLLLNNLSIIFWKKFSARDLALVPYTKGSSRVFSASPTPLYTKQLALQKERRQPHSSIRPMNRCWMLFATFPSKATH